MVIKGVVLREAQIEKNMEHEMETAVIQGLDTDLGYLIYVSTKWKTSSFPVCPSCGNSF